MGNSEEEGNIIIDQRLAVSTTIELDKGGSPVFFSVLYVPKLPFCKGKCWPGGPGALACWPGALA